MKHRTALIAALAGGGVLLSAAPASAVETDYAYECNTSAGILPATATLDGTAASPVAPGDPLPLSAISGSGVLSLPAGGSGFYPPTFNADISIDVDGDWGQTLTTTTTVLVTNAADTLSFGPDPFPDLGYTAPAFPGPVTFSPATVVIDPVDADMVDHPGTETPATCERTGAERPFARADVVDAPAPVVPEVPLPILLVGAGAAIMAATTLRRRAVV